MTPEMRKKIASEVKSKMHLTPEQYREFAHLAEDLDLELVEREPETTWEDLDRQL